MLKLIFRSIFFLATVGLIAGACGSTKENDNDNETTEDAEPTSETVGPEGPIDYTSDGVTMKGYFAYDVESNEKRPGILVVHEWWGHNDYARKRADMLAELGYVALAVDMYGDGKTAEHPDDAGKFAQEVMSNADVAAARFNSALKVLKDHPAVDKEKIGAIGYCFGGSVVLSMASSGADLDAVAAFHAGLGFPMAEPEEGSVKAKILVCNGADDSFVTQEQIDNFKSSMDAAGADYTFINYEGAVHSFTSKDADELAAKFDMPLAYNEEADQQSWEEMKKLFAEAF